MVCQRPAARDLGGRQETTMKKELDEALCHDFPLLYADRNESMKQSLMCFGFEVGDGWYGIIHELSEKLEAMIAAQPADKQHLFRALQVKEKFGTLRFYMTASTDEMNSAISHAEQLSAVTCADCGLPAQQEPRSGWWSTLCDRCAEDRDKR